MKFFDAHCHLQLPQYDLDREVIIAHMRKVDMGAIVVGTDYETSKAALDLVSRGPEGPLRDLWASVGLHPNDNKDEHFDISKYEELAQDPKVVAIGECGLDYYRSEGTDEEKAVQKVRFEQQIELAVTVGKPLIIHCRNAHDDMLEILKEHMSKRPALRVVIHFFTGSGELAKQYLDLGCYLSFPGPITYTDMYDESIRIASLDKILSETDSPFAAPVPHRGKRNEPVFVEEVVKKIATIKELSVEEVSEQIVLNSKKVFGW